MILLQGKPPQTGPQPPKRHLNAKQAVRRQKARGRS